MCRLWSRHALRQISTVTKSRTMQPPGFVYNSRLPIMTKLCGGVGFTSRLAGDALSVLRVHLFQPSLQVLSLLDVQRPIHNRAADHMECADRSKRETRKRTKAKRSPIGLLYSHDPATETTNFPSVLAAVDIKSASNAPVRV